MGIYDRTKDACKNAGLSVQAVERMAGLGNGAISKWNNVTPRADTLFSVAKILQVSPGWLLTGEGQAEAHEAKPKVVGAGPMAELIQEARDKYGIMFDQDKGATIEEVKATIAFIKAMRGLNKED